MPEEFLEEEDFQTKFNGQTFKRLLGLMKPHLGKVAIFLGSILIVSVMDAYFTYLMKQIVDTAIIPRNTDILIGSLEWYGALVIVEAIFVLIFIYVVGILGERIRYELRQKMFNHLQELSLSYYSKTPVGWIMSRVTSDSDRVADLITWGVLDSTWGVVNILTSLVFMFFINWKLALVMLVIIPILVVAAIEFRKRILVEYRKVRKTNSKIVGAFNENITGVRVVKALSREDANIGEFQNLTNEMYRSAFRASWLSALFLPIVQIISAVALGAIVWAGGLQVQAGTITIGGIQAFVSYVAFMMWPIQNLARVFAEMQQAIASAERIFSLVDAAPEVKNRENAYDPGSIQGDIDFDHVSFAYSDAPEVPVLRDLNLHIHRGQMIALVGETGGGKTTTVNLLARFYEPTDGEIRIGGVNYLDYSLQSIQSRIGVVLQTPHLFSGTIRENIRYGRLDATNEEIEKAAELAGAHDFILRFPKGYDEEVGEGGNLLSVGQKQLISLARAVLAKPEIFIMDEATSSVDTLTESLIQRGMETLLKQCTSFVIAHRLSTIRRADQILVIEDGHVAEMGNHSELLRRKGKYFNLYTRQFRNEMEEAYDPLKVNEPVSIPA